MNKQQLTRLERINQKLGYNLVNMKDLIRWCEGYKDQKVDIGQIMGVFTLKYNDVAFIIENLEEIKTLKVA